MVAVAERDAGSVNVAVVVAVPVNDADNVAEDVAAGVLLGDGLRPSHEITTRPGPFEAATPLA
jgi:hypothetical protein